MNRPRLVLMEACTADLRPKLWELREAGWPAELIAMNSPDFFGLRLEVNLGGVPVPLEAEPADSQGEGESE